MAADRGSANERFKARYRPLLLACLGRSVILHVLALAAVPGIWVRTSRPIPAVAVQEVVVCGPPPVPPVVWYSRPNAGPAEGSDADERVHDSAVGSSYSMLATSEHRTGGAP